jgi:hypothetical protein
VSKILETVQVYKSSNFDDVLYTQIVAMLYLAGAGVTQYRAKPVWRSYLFRVQGMGRFCFIMIVK